MPELGEAKINFSLSAEQRESSPLSPPREIDLSFEEGTLSSAARAPMRRIPLGLNTLTGLLGHYRIKTEKPVAEAVKELSLLFPYGEHDGKSVGLKISDEISGELTLCPSILRFDGKA